MSTIGFYNRICSVLVTSEHPRYSFGFLVFRLLFSLQFSSEEMSSLLFSKGKLIFPVYFDDEIGLAMCKYFFDGASAEVRDVVSQAR